MEDQEGHVNTVPDLFEPLGILLSLLSLTKSFLVVDVVMILQVIFCALWLFCSLEHSYSDPRSFMTCCH